MTAFFLDKRRNVFHIQLCIHFSYFSFDCLDVSDKNLSIYLYFGISLLYRFYLFQDEWRKQIFEKICICFEHFEHWIPIDFMLGFYVTLVVTR